MHAIVDEVNNRGIDPFWSVVIGGAVTGFFGWLVARTNKPKLKELERKADVNTKTITKIAQDTQQMYPNGGNSQRDVINRVEDMVLSLMDQFDGMNETVKATASRVGTIDRRQATMEDRQLLIDTKMDETKRAHDKLLGRVDEVGRQVKEVKEDARTLKIALVDSGALPGVTPPEDKH